MRILNLIRGMFRNDDTISDDMISDNAISYDVIEVQMDPGASGTITFRLDGEPMKFFPVLGGETFILHLPHVLRLYPKDPDP